MNMEVTIELGHKAWKNIKPTKEGYTHDWIAFVQGVNGSEIKHIVKKVIFYLPDSYQDPKRIKKVPPFIVSDSSSENISIKIYVCFCAEAKLDKVNYIYNLDISKEDASWMRKLTFPNPSKKFKEKLLLAGGEFYQKPPPALNEGLLKCKAENNNEITTQNDTIAKATLNAADQNLDKFKEIVKENENLKKSNMEIKDKIELQEKLMACYEANFSFHETKILNTTVGINQLKKKIEDDEREISGLKLQLQLLQNALLQLKNSPSEIHNFEEKFEKTNKKNEDINLSIPLEKENVSLLTESSSLPIRDILKPEIISEFHKSASVSTKNQNFGQTGQLSSIASVTLNASQKNALVVLSDLCNTSRNFSFSQSKNETQSLNPTHLQKLSINQNLGTLGCHENATDVALSLNSTNICDAQKPIQNKSFDIDVSPNEFDIGNKVVDKSLNNSLIESNSSLNTDKMIITDSEKYPKVNSDKANNSLNKSDKIIIGDKKSSKKNLASTNDSLNTPEDAEKSTNKSEKAIDSKKSSKRNSADDDDSPEIIFEADKSTKRLAANQNNVPEIITIDEEKSVKKNRKRKLSKNKKLNKDQNIIKGNMLENATSLSIEPETNKTQEPLETFVNRADTKSSKSNLNENNLKTVFDEKTPLTLNQGWPKRKRKKKLKAGSERRRNENLRMKFISDESNQIIINIPPSEFITFMTEHCRKLAKELDRIKNSEFRIYRESPNPLFSKLTNIDTNLISEEGREQFLQSLIDYFSNSETFDKATLIYLIVDYLCHDRIPHSRLPTYIQNEDIIVYLAPSENCIITALYEVEGKSLPHLTGLITNILDIIHQVIISKKKLAVNGLASLCRVFNEICRRSIDKWKPLYLCCELLKFKNPLAPYLIMTIASVWRDPFKISNKFSAEENIILGAIMYGIKKKPLLMENNLWSLTCNFKNTYFPVPFKTDCQQATQFLTNKIISSCIQGSFQNIWTQALPLIIFVSKESSAWMSRFRNEYILPSLWHFLKISNENGFSLFCNLFVDIFSVSLEGVYEIMLQYFSNPVFHQGIKFVYDCAAVALLKYICLTDKSIPPPLKD